MRGTTLWGALLAAWTILTTGLAFGQGTLEYAPPDTVFPVPLGSTRPEAGGFFAAGKFLFYRQTNPIKDQFVAVRGFTTTSNDVLGNNPDGSKSIGQNVGSQTQALNVEQVAGPNSYQPGWGIDVGWKFGDGSAVTLGWKRLTEAKYSAAATLFPRNFQLGANFEETFLTAPVFNFPNQFNGPTNDVTRQSDGSDVFNGAAGIWNAATVMEISFVQRFDDWFITYRQPVFETECYRFNGLMGPRLTWIWERFKWRTVNADVDGNAGGQDVAYYSNVTSNRMYGVFIGTEQEWYIGHGFAVTADVRATAYVDIVKEVARYELADKSIANKRARRDYTIVPEAEASLGLTWYPIEAVQVKVGYDVMAFFNTMSSPRPITFDYSGLNPAYERTYRIFDGFQAAVAISF